MNTLSDIELNALAEIFNIGAGRAALSLSELIGDAGHLLAPSIHINDLDIIINKGRFVAVSQQFTGSLQATATLFISEQYALEIVSKMLGSEVGSEQLAEFQQEAMCELGNIVFYACLTAMADMLGIAVEGSLPSYEFAPLNELLLRFNQTITDFTIMLSSDLAIEQDNAEKKLIFVLSFTSLDNLAEHIKRFLGELS